MPTAERLGSHQHDHECSIRPLRSVLELGAGCGAVGMYAALRGAAIRKVVSPVRLEDIENPRAGGRFELVAQRVRSVPSVPSTCTRRRTMTHLACVATRATANSPHSFTFLSLPHSIGSMLFVLMVLFPGSGSRTL